MRDCDWARRKTDDLRSGVVVKSQGQWEHNISQDLLNNQMLEATQMSTDR